MASRGIFRCGDRAARPGAAPARARLPGGGRGGLPGRRQLVRAEFLALPAGALPVHRLRLAASRPVRRRLIDGDEQLVFLGVLAIGLVIEAFWYLMHRATPGTPGPRGSACLPARWLRADS